MGYKVGMLCFDSADGVIPYEEEPAISPIFETKDEAFAYAKSLAEDEVDGLNGADGIEPDDGVSFGIPEDKDYQAKNSVAVCQYYNPDGDDTGETNQVTVYFVKVSA